MATTYIDTNKIPRVKLPAGLGQAAEILNRDLAGAENVVGTLRWLGNAEHFDAEPKADTHQLVYLMEGAGVITLGEKDYPVTKGAGVYLGPSETASIRPQENATLKLFHLVVPAKKD